MQLGEQAVAVGRVEHDRALEQLALHVVGRPDHRDPAVVDDAHAIRLLGLLEVVGGQEHGGAVLVADVAQVAPQPVAADRVEAGRRLVEEQDPGPVHQAPDDLELALHAARVAPQRLEQLALEPDHVGQVLDPLAVLRRHQPVERAVAVDPVQGDVQADVLLGREVEVDRRVLEDDPDAGADRLGVAIQVVAVDDDGAAGLGQGRREDRDRGRLAGPVRAEEGEQLALADVEADVVDGGRGALLVALGQVLDADNGVHGMSCLRGVLTNLPVGQ